MRDRSGQPLAGAEITAFQTRLGIIDDQPSFSGNTASDGRFLLPNRPVSPTLTTATGHTLGPNPFGLIDVVGRNAQLSVARAAG